MNEESGDPRTAEQGIGRSLRRAREIQGLSLAEVEERTRIRSRYLRDLEREDFDILPAVYVTGSLKTYANFLGLDGAALSRELKVRLQEPARPDIPAQIAALEDPEDGGRRPAILPAAGFDQLFLGAGVLLVSILAIMTVAAAVAQGGQTPVSEIKEPSTPEVPAEIALAGNAWNGPVPPPVKEAGGSNRDGRYPAGPGKGGGGGDRNQVDDRRVPDPNPVVVASAPAGSPEAESPTSASASPEPGTRDVPGASSTASASASAGAGPPAPSRGGVSPEPRAGREARPPPVSDPHRISARVDRAVDEAFANVGLD